MGSDFGGVGDLVRGRLAKCIVGCVEAFGSAPIGRCVVRCAAGRGGGFAFCTCGRGVDCCSCLIRSCMAS